MKKALAWFKKWGWLVLLGLVGVLATILLAVLTKKPGGFVEKLNDSINRKVLESDADYVYEKAIAKAANDQAELRVKIAAKEPDPKVRRDKIVALLQDL